MSAIQTILQKYYEISRKMIKTEGYSKKSKELALERIEHLKEHSKLLLHERKQKVKQLSRQTNSIRKKQEDRKKSKEDEEEERRQKILKSRKLKQQIATEKFQRYTEPPKKGKNKRQGFGSGLRDGLYNVRGHVIEIKNGVRVGSTKQKEPSNNCDVVVDNQLVMSPILQKTLYSPGTTVADQLNSFLGDLKDNREYGSTFPVNAIKTNQIQTDVSDWVPNHHNKTQGDQTTYIEPSNGKEKEIQCRNDMYSSLHESTDSLNGQLNLRSSLKGMNIRNLSDSIERKVTFSKSIHYNDGCTEPLNTKMTDRIPLYKRLQNNTYPKERVSAVPVARTTEETLDQLRQEMLIPLYPRYNDYSYPDSVKLLENTEEENSTVTTTPVDNHDIDVTSQQHILKDQSSITLNTIQHTSNTEDCLETKLQRTNSLSDEEYFDSLAEDVTVNRKSDVPTSDVLEVDTQKYHYQKPNLDSSFLDQNNNRDSLMKPLDSQISVTHINSLANDDKKLNANTFHSNTSIQQLRHQENEIPIAQPMHSHHPAITSINTALYQDSYTYSLSYVSQPLNNVNLSASLNGYNGNQNFSSFNFNSPQIPSYSSHSENINTETKNLRSEQHYNGDVTPSTIPVTAHTSHMLEYTAVNNNTQWSVNPLISMQKLQSNVTTVHASTFPHTNGIYFNTENVISEPSQPSLSYNTGPFLQRQETGKQLDHVDGNELFKYDNSDSNPRSNGFKNNLISLDKMEEAKKPSDEIYDDIEKSLAGLTLENGRSKLEEKVSSPRPKVIPHGKEQQPFNQLPSQKIEAREFTSPRQKSDKINEAVRDGSAIPIRIHSNTARRGRIIVSATKRKPLTGFAPHPPQTSKNAIEEKDVSVTPQEKMNSHLKSSPNSFHRRSVSANAIVSKKPPLMAKQRPYSNSAIKPQSHHVQNQNPIPSFENWTKTHPNNKNLSTPLRQIPLDKTPTDDEINKLWENVRECLSTESAEHESSDLSTGANPSFKHQRSISGSSHNRISANIVYRRQNSSDSISSTSSFSKRQPLLPQRASKMFANTRSGNTTAENNHGVSLRGAKTESNKYREVTPSMATFLTLEEMCAKDSLISNPAPAAFQLTRQNRYPGAVTALSVEEQRVMKSLERINLRLKEQERKLVI